MTDAACTMIAGPWRGDTVIYVGDYWTEDSFDDERSRRLFAKFDGYPYEDILKRFKNVTGHFEEAQGHKYGDYLHFEKRGDVFDEPYTGSFDLRVRSWRAMRTPQSKGFGSRPSPGFGLSSSLRDVNGMTIRRNKATYPHGGSQIHSKASAASQESAGTPLTKISDIGS